MVKHSASPIPLPDENRNQQYERHHGFYLSDPAKTPGFFTAMTPAEQATMDQHSDYVRDMIAPGQIFLDAGTPDGTIGVIIYRVFSAIEARRLFYSDPAVIAGLGYPKLYPLTVGHLAAS